MNKISADAIRTLGLKIAKEWPLSGELRGELSIMLHALAAEREQAMAPTVLVTDEIARKAIQAYIAETGTVENGRDEALPIDCDGMRAALEAVALLLRGEGK